MLLFTYKYTFFMAKRLYSIACLCILMLTATAQNAVNIVADPADGSTVEKLSQITLTFEGASTVDQGLAASSITITSDGNYSAGCSLGYGDNDNQMVVSFTEVTEKATYTLTFPENAFSAEGATIPAFTLTYKIGEDVPEGLLLTPNGGSVTWLTDITVVAAAAPTKSLSAAWNATETPTLTGPNGESIVIDGSSVYDVTAGYSTYHISPRLLITTPGEYTLTIPDDYFYYYDDSWNSIYLPGTTATFSIATGNQEVFTSVPAKDPPVSQFQTLTITFPNATTVASNSSANVILYRDTTTWVGSGSLSYNFTFDGNTMSYSVYQPVIDAGHYTMTFPEGCLLLDEQPNAPFMVEFDIVENEPLNIAITPAQDANIEGILNSAAITFPDETAVSYNPGSITLFRVTDTGDVSIASAYGEQTTVKQDDGKTFIVSFPGIATVSGTYKIHVPKNLFTTGERFNSETDVTFSYTAPEPVAFEVTPAADSELDRIQNFTITFAGNDDVTVNTAFTSASILLYKGVPHKDEYGYLTGGSQLSSIALSNIQKTEGTKGEFTFSFSTPGIEKDDYALIIPTGIFLVGDKTFNMTDTLVYHATGNGLDKIVASPSYPVRKLKNVTLTFVNETSVVFQSNYASTSLYMVNPESSYNTYKESISSTKSDWAGYVSIDEKHPNKLNIELMNEYVDPGEYYIDLTSYFLFMSDGTTPNTVNKIYFTVDPLATGISDIQTVQQADAPVYTINGVKVKDMNRPGLYIQNGRKVIKK